MSRRRPSFLEDNVDHDQLLAAVAANHRAWMTRVACAGDGEVHREGGTEWIYRAGREPEVTIAFPHWTGRQAGKRLDRILSACRRIEGLRQVACWSLLQDPSPPELGAILAARGFEWGWRPHWMWLHLSRLRDARRESIPVRIEVISGDAPWDAKNLPYYDPDTFSRLVTLSRAKPRRVWFFAAYLDGRPVGHSVLNLTTGALGVAGIFNVGVVPEVRRQGVGAAVTRATLLFARDLGARHALLNSTDMGERLYRRLGFHSLAYGQTWWLHQEVLQAPPLPQDQVLFWEAAGRGEVELLSATGSLLGTAELDAKTPAGMTALQLAVRTSQPRSVDWLLEHGATPDLLSAWELGWKDRIPTLLSSSPKVVNWRSGRWQLTPLHEAVLRDDLELTRLILSGDPDLNAQDTKFHSTPLGWARHLGRQKIAALIEAQGANAGPEGSV